MNQYIFSYDESHVITMLSRYRRLRKVFPWFIAVKIICFLGLATLLALMVFASLGHKHNGSGSLLLVVLVITFFIVLLFLGPNLDYLILKRRLKKSPFYGVTIQFVVAESGVDAKTPKSQVSLAWSAFTAAKRVTGGFLLFSGPGEFYWLPDEALEIGSIGNVEHLFEANLVNYESKA